MAALFARRYTNDIKDELQEYLPIAMDCSDQLQKAALEIIDVLSTVRDFADAKIALVGDLAYWRYIPTGTARGVIEFLLICKVGPDGIKQRLLSLPGTRFVQHAQQFCYTSIDGEDTPVNFLATAQLPYIPTTLPAVQDLPSGSVALASPIDLLLFQMFSSGWRPNVADRIFDAEHATALAEFLTNDGPYPLNEHNKAFAERSVDNVVEYGPQDRAWWERQLHLFASN